jgi:predicted O-methyltransferase YrrM
LIDEKFDLVYIDGVHTYEQVKKDIENYRKIVKPNGLLCGHDYLNEGHLVGVFEAVNEIFGKPDIIFEDTTWLIKL